MPLRRPATGLRTLWFLVPLALLDGLGAVHPRCAPAVEPAALVPLTLASDAVPFSTAIGSATSQGVAVLKADQARSIFGVTGAGIRLGVVSDSFNGSGSTPTLAGQIAAGNLPGAGNPGGYTTGVTVLNDATGTDEGRAMLEIVHDVAPAAQLYFHSAFNNTQTPGYTNADTAAPDQTIADAIAGLAGVSGMRIIVDDVFIMTAPRFQDGAAARAVNAAYGQGIAYFSAAGNSASNATRVTTSAGVNGTVNWGTDDLLRMRINAYSTGRMTLQWGEPYPSVSGPAATSNFVVAATNTGGSVTYFTVDEQWAGEDPYEFVSVTNSNPVAIDFAFRVTRTSGTAPVTMQLSTFDSTMTITDGDRTNAPTINGHAAAAGAVAVAASYWGTPTTVEGFSSRGPTLVMFDADGVRIDETRSTPLLTAPDGGTTTTAGFSAFYGTSAAAPHAAAVAALVLERFDQKGLAVSTRDLYQVLFDAAVDMAPAGFDVATGHGRIDALAAVSAGRIWDGNGATAGVSGTGAWSEAKWTLEDGGDKPTGRFIRGQPAIFGSGTAAATTYAVTVDGGYDVAGLSFTRDTVTLAPGGGTLRLVAPAVDVGTGITATVAAPLTGTSGLHKLGSGTLRITGSMAYSGNTTVAAGTLRVEEGGSFAAGNVFDVWAGAAIDFNGRSQSLTSLSGSGNLVLGGGTLTVDGTAASTYAGTLAGGTLLKTGSGKLALTGSSALASAIVDAGLLSVDGVLSGSITVAPAGWLGGSGTIAGSVSLGGTHVPGNSPGVSSVTGDLEYGAGATVVWELAADTATQGPVGGRTFDQILVGGDLTFTGSTTLTLAFVDQETGAPWPSTVDWTDDFWNVSRAWTLWTVTGSTSGFSNLTLAAGSWLDAQGTAFATVEPGRAFSLAVSGNDIRLVFSVPEPPAIVLAAAGVAGGGLWRARRRRPGGGQPRPPD